MLLRLNTPQVSFTRFMFSKIQVWSAGSNATRFNTALRNSPTRRGCRDPTSSHHHKKRHPRAKCIIIFIEPNTSSVLLSPRDKEQVGRQTQVKRLWRYNMQELEELYKNRVIHKEEVERFSYREFLAWYNKPDFDEELRRKGMIQGKKTMEWYSQLNSE